MNTPSKPVRILAAAVTAVAMTACAGQAVPAQATMAPATATVTAPEIPSTPAGNQLRWLLDAAARPPISESELAQHFSAGFLKSIPPAQINQVLANFTGMRLERLTKSQDRALIARVAAGGTSYEVILSVDAAGLIDGLQFRPPAPTSWAELDERLSKVAPETGFLAAELTKRGDCRPAHAVARDTARPLGSMFKLYVLGTVAERIKSGAFGWNTRLTITPELKSLPSGELQNRPDYSKVSVLEAAKLMISISDNTATDLLIHKVGRKAVERTMRAWGAHDKRNVPLLTTRELFVLKGADYPRHAKRYLSLGTAQRRAYLDKVVAKTPLSTVRPWTTPRELDTLEWYASPADLCRAYAQLVKLGDQRIGEVMSINDAGLGLDRGEWRTVWYKGGSEPGVLDLSFLARTSGGTSYVVTAMATNPDAPFGEQVGLDLLALVRGAFALVEE
ncbi:beta-lactamase class A [Nonomuraea polychroma]|uniref:Beta-lactamase class A n=1 Tax=Nonomuraea polychroma TaxID=46176 RepID=A0A438ME53_9ACTN|nr:serine hydrolase [Nonomuraea polychroma]RVX44032.1 beta-lactamase class A [Nonomuraea polychroma]